MFVFSTCGNNWEISTDLWINMIMFTQHEFNEGQEAKMFIIKVVGFWRPMSFGNSSRRPMHRWCLILGVRSWRDDNGNDALSIGPELLQFPDPHAVGGDDVKGDHTKGRCHIQWLNRDENDPCMVSRTPHEFGIARRFGRNKDSRNFSLERRGGLIFIFPITLRSQPGLLGFDLLFGAFEDHRSHNMVYQQLHEPETYHRTRSIERIDSYKL